MAPTIAYDCGTNLRYGDVQLADVETLRFEQEVVYDESGTDKIAEKYILSIRAWVHESDYPKFGSYTP